VGLRSHEALMEAALPVLVGAVVVVGEALHGAGSAKAMPIVLGLGAAATLWARVRWPGWTLVVSGALVGVLFGVDRSAATVAVLAPAVALYSLALRRGRRVQLLAGLAAVGAVLMADLLHSGRPGIPQTLGHALLVAIPLLAAQQVRTHRANMALLADRLAEQERMRIARELHDVVAHTLTEINVQAGAAAERSRPGEARSALERIEDASREAIAELRAVLGVLRHPDPAEAPRTPTPGVADIGELVERSRASGLDVTLEIGGERPARISESASLAAFRIVQESLTNARRHAPGTPVRVVLRFDAAEMSLAIENTHGASSNGNGGTPGVGITGMRERALAVGGTLEAQPTGHGFVVRAQLPCR
jgi:signal transduction histidine kinase